MERQVNPNQKSQKKIKEISESTLEKLQELFHSEEDQDDGKKDELYHYGTPRHSGRYPWGSGENPYQGDMDFKAHYNSLKKKGWTQKEIAKSMKMNTSQLRARVDIASENVTRARDAAVFKLRDKGYSKMAIARQLDIPESTVRNVLKNVEKVKENSTRSVAESLKQAVGEQRFVDIGHGCESQMNISKDKLRHAVALLEQEGYKISYHEQPQMGTGKTTMMKVLVTKDTPWVEVERARKNAEIDFPGFHYEHGDYDNPHKLESPRPVAKERVKIVTPSEGGSLQDGIIKLRPGCEDLNLGRNSYAQVRINVNDTHYAKGVAIYGDPKEFPDGIDILVYSSKPDDMPMLGPKNNSVLKPLKPDPITNNPFGASINQDDQGETRHPLKYFQTHYIGKDGKEYLSALNIVNEQGTWDEWNRNLSSQFLAKQTIPLAKRQLSLDARMRHDDFEEIKTIDNPVVRKNLLESFADNCDSAAVHLKAAALPRQAMQLIIPFPKLKEDEIYAPNFRDGEKVCLVRFPHTGRFEIPELTVNNRFEEGKRVIGAVDPTIKRDAVGINPKVAQQLSGADFDGDTVLVIPNDNGYIKTKKPLEGMDKFNEEMHERYKRPANSPYQQMTPHEKGMQMGLVSNLITDMTLHGATPDELTRAVKHSMVVIDAEKHDLDWRQSAEDNNIRQLYLKYQKRALGGASTLISQASGEKDVKHRKAGERRIDPETGKPRVFYIDPKTGEKLWTYTGKETSRRVLKDVKDPVTGAPVIDPKTKQKIKEPVLDENGKPIWKKVPVMIKSQKMYEEKDAMNLSSGTQMEAVYGEYAN
ncbi:MAG: helix-turn-helix domain-containing protein, partial [Bacteroidota bacterium]|nr:helix-turn-helix domain-containing protein [Bacteroidota bacterium]